MAAPSEIALFLVADALRQEVGGKSTIMGAYAGGQILVAPGTPFPISVPLAIYAVFEDGDGTFKTRVRIFDQNGNLVAGEFNVGNSVKNLGKPLQLMVNFNIFRFPFPGVYKIEILLDEHIYAKNISVSLSDKPIP